MAQAAPKPDLPAEGSGVDFSTLGREQRIDQAIAAYKAQQAHEILMLVGIVVAVLVVAGAIFYWLNKRNSKHDDKIRSL